MAGFHSLARLHERALSTAKRMHGALNTHKAAIGEIVSEAVRSGESVAGGATAAALDHYLAPAGVAVVGGIPEAMMGPVPVVPVAALALKGAAFMFTKSRFSADLHAFSNGMGAAATYAAVMRLLQTQATASGT